MEEKKRLLKLYNLLKNYQFPYLSSFSISISSYTPVFSPKALAFHCSFIKFGKKRIIHCFFVLILWFNINQDGCNKFIAL